MCYSDFTDEVGKYRNETQESKQRLNQTRKELARELQKDQVSESNLLQLKQDILDIQSNKLDDMINLRKALNTILTPEQRNQMIELKNQRKDLEDSGSRRFFRKK